MTADRGPDPVARAAEALREEDAGSAQWPEVAVSVRSRVRGLTRPSPVALVDPEATDDGARTWIAARVVVAMLRERLATDVAAPRDVAVEVEDGRCREVRVDLVCAYGADLHAAGAMVRGTVAGLLAELRLGPPGPDVRVGVVDVVEGDPRVV